MTENQKPAAKKPRSRKPPPHVDHDSYWMVTFAFYDHDQLAIDSALHEGTLTQFLTTVNDEFDRPSIINQVELTKDLYHELDAALESTEAGEERVHIGDGLKARVLDDDFGEPLEDSKAPPEGMHFRRGDPDEFEEGDGSLERDAGPLGDFEEDED